MHSTFKTTKMVQLKVNQLKMKQTMSYRINLIKGLTFNKVPGNIEICCMQDTTERAVTESSES